MGAQDRNMRFGMILAVVVLAVTLLAAVDASAQDDLEVNYRARAISTLNIERAAADDTELLLATPNSTGADRPNILFIIVDD